MNSNYERLSVEDASQVLEHLRAKVREFGFGALDAEIGRPSIAFIRTVLAPSLSGPYLLKSLK
eukprot:gene10034-11759_t